MRWEEYVKTLVNLKNERVETDMINKTEGPIHDVTKEDVKPALSQMSNVKPGAPSDVSA